MVERLLSIPISDSDVQRRGRALILIASSQVVMLLLTLIITGMWFFSLIGTITILFGMLLLVSVIMIARRGWIDLAGITLVVVGFCLISMPMFLSHGMPNLIIFFVLLIIVTGFVLRPWQVWPVLVGILALIGLKVWISDYSSDPYGFLSNTLILLIAASMLSYLGGKIMDQAFQASTLLREEAEETAIRFEQLSLSLENQIAVRTVDLRQALIEVEKRAAEKQALIDENELQRATIREMSVPVLPVSNKTLVMPLVGDLDSSRMQSIQRQALSAVQRTGARRLLFDITGVPMVDTYVADGLLRTIRAVRLLGVQTLLIGVRPEVAQSMVSLGVDLGDLRTASDLESALREWH